MSDDEMEVCCMLTLAFRREYISLESHIECIIQNSIAFVVDKYCYGQPDSMSLNDWCKLNNKP